MNATQTKILPASIIIGVFSFLFICSDLFSQDILTTDKGQFVTTRINNHGMDEDALRAELKKNGITDIVINQIIVQQRNLIKNYDQKSLFGKKDGGPIPSIMGTCADLGAENGWSDWQGTKRNTTTTAPTGAMFQNPFGPPTAPTFNITTGAGLDPCTPGPTGPPFPVVAPGYGNFSIQLGNPREAGWGAERLIFPLTVNAADTNFWYAYAFVIQDAQVNGTPHTPADQPYVDFVIVDANGDTVDCSFAHYFGGPNLPGVYQTQPGCNNALAPWNGNVGQGYYRPWTTIGVNLSAYVGQTLTVIITNVDCAQGGHYAYSYWDFKCPTSAIVNPSYCLGSQVTLAAPPSDPINPYSYSWYQNGQPYTGTPDSTSANITPFPVPGDTFAVKITQLSGCGFWAKYVPVPLLMNADFTLANNCGVVSFADATVSSSAGPIVTWNWSMAGGSPSTANTSSVSATYPPGTYSITLIATSQNGCVDTVEKSVTVVMPAATFTTAPCCVGATTSLNSPSSTASTDPIASWNWNMPGATPSTSSSQSFSTIYNTPGTYSITLDVTTQAGCKDTVVQTITINPLPVAAFTAGPVCFNNPTVFTNQSTGATTYAWDFGDGNSSTQQSPSHTYGTSGTFTTTLVVTNAFGCKDTVPMTTIVNPLPVVNFNSLPVCVGDQTTFTDGSTVTPGAITGWTWNFGDPGSGAANTSTLQNPNHTYAAAGTYTVILTATSDSNCQSTTMLPVTIHPFPTAAFSPTSPCLGASTVLTDGSIASPGDPIASWNWSMPGGIPASATSQNGSTIYNTSGTHTISLIVTSTFGCRDTIDQPVVIYNPPTANFGSPISGCAPVCNNYVDSSSSVDGTIDSWRWTFPGGSPSASTVQNPQNICYYTPGSYSVSLIVSTTYGCTDTIDLPMVTVYDDPIADFCVTPSVAPTTNPVFNFCDLWSSDVVQWTWNFGDNDTDIVSTDPVHSYSASATQNDFYEYEICLRVENQYGCWDDTCKPVELLPEFTFFIPNTFTPNQDKTNEFFFGKSRGVKEYSIWLFDRWGNQIWDCHRDDKNTNWDSDATVPKQEGLSSACQWDGVVVRGGLDMSGNSRQYAQEDVYVWKVRLRDIFNKTHMYIGHVTIVK